MTRDELTQDLQSIARDIFMKDDLILTDSLSATDLDTWTSLSFMQFLTAIEDKYAFKFKMMELLKLQTMGAVIDATLNHIA